MTNPPRWITDTQPGHSQWYIQRFRTMAAEGADLAGEARFVDTVVPRHARILDAGCGPGRVAAELYRRGHDVVGVDVDPELIAAAETDHPGPTWLVADLSVMDLTAMGQPEPFDLALCVGNVMTFLARDTERLVLQRLADHVRQGGLVVIGFATDRGYPVADFDDDAAAAGLVLEHRFSTWDLRPWASDATFSVSVLRRPVAR